MKVKQKLLLSFLSLALLSSGVTGSVAIKQQIDNAQSISVTEAEDIATVISHTITFKYREQYTLLEEDNALQRYTDELHDRQNRDIVVVDLNKKILSDVVRENVGSVFSHDRGNEINQTIQDGQIRPFVEISVDYPQGIKLIVAPLKNQNGQTLGAVIVEYTSLYNAIVAAANPVIFTTLGAMIGSTLLAVALGYKISRSISDPIQRLKEAARDLAQGDIQRRVSVQTKDELGELAKSFNQMASDLELLYAEEKQKTIILQESKVQLTQKNQELKQTLQKLQQMQTQLVQAEKMSSLGQLVAGVAHEINNPVNFIHGNLTYVQEHTQSLMNFVHLYQKHYPNLTSEIQAEAEELDIEFIQTDLPKTLNSMKMGTDRIRQIVLSLRNFSRVDEAEIKAVNIHEGIDSTLMILQHRLKARPERPEIELIKDYCTLPLVECHVGQLNQVFMNILVNAIDALEESSAKRTYQECKNTPSQITIRTSALDSEWVQIAIADNGVGISGKAKQRIFDPFFTTKPVGKGTGMGMSISHQIITEKHQGKLERFSEYGEGAEFIIQIPVSINKSVRQHPNPVGADC